MYTTLEHGNCVMVWKGETVLRNALTTQNS
jgi:hypothetical protein